MSKSESRGASSFEADASFNAEQMAEQEKQTKERREAGITAELETSLSVLKDRLSEAKTLGPAAGLSLKIAKECQEGAMHMKETGEYDGLSDYEKGYIDEVLKMTEEEAA